MKHLPGLAAALFAAVILAACASRGEPLCGGSFKSQVDLERVHGKQPPASPSATTSY